VWSLANIKINERYAAGIYMDYVGKDEENRIENDKLLDLVNKNLSEYNRL